MITSSPRAIRTFMRWAAATLATTSAALVMSVAFAPAASAQECEGPSGAAGQVVVSEGGNRSCVGVYPDGSYFNVPLAPAVEYSSCLSACDSPPVLVVVRRTH